MEIAKVVVGIIHILLSIVLIALILLQSGKEAGLSGAVAGAADSFFGKNKGRTMDAIFSKFTKICAIGFLITSLFLAYGDSIITASPATESQTTVTPSEAPEVSEQETSAETEEAPEVSGSETSAETEETPEAE